MTDPILYQQSNKIGILKINRPKARNSLSWEAQERFADQIETISADLPRVLILTGAGQNAFVAGGDLKELAENPIPETGKRLHQTMTAALNQLSTMPIPIIAAVNGHTAGGGLEILAACDLRIAAPSAQFHFAHIRMGLTTGWGGMRRMLAILGKAKLTEYMLSGVSLTAEEGLASGLLQRISDEKMSVLDMAVHWAEQIIQLPSAPLAATKELIHLAASALPDEQFTTQETARFLSLFGQPANREALAAFQEKRRPNFNQVRRDTP